MSILDLEGECMVKEWGAFGTASCHSAWDRRVALIVRGRQFLDNDQEHRFIFVYHIGPSSASGKDVFFIWDALFDLRLAHGSRAFNYDAQELQHRSCKYVNSRFTFQIPVNTPNYLCSYLIHNAISWNAGAVVSGDEARELLHYMVVHHEFQKSGFGTGRTASLIVIGLVPQNARGCVGLSATVLDDHDSADIGGPPSSSVSLASSEWMLGRALKRGVVSMAQRTDITVWVRRL